MAADEPTIVYFKSRGRAEVVKVAFAIAGQSFTFEEIKDRSQLKEDWNTFPFGQVPILKIGSACIPQAAAQLRYIGRAHDLYGSNNLEATMIDALIEGLNDLSSKTATVIRTQADKREEAKASFHAAHVDPASKAQSNGGAHFAYIANLVEAYGSGFAVGSKPSIADAMLFGRLDSFTALFGSSWRDLYPALAAVVDRVAELPNVKAYLESGKRLPNIIL